MSEKWVTEAAHGYGNTIRVTKELFRAKSEFQTIEIYETEKLGKLLLLDGIIQLTSYDEFAYQEMMANLPFYAHPAPETALVIGGGDGGVLRELGRHRELRSLDICEIDAAVIDAAKRFLPELACGFDDPRVAVHIADGSVFIREHVESYDLIVVDSTDPGGPGAPAPAIPEGMVRSFDQNFCLNHTEEGLVEVVASVYSPTSGRVLEVLNDKPGLQFFSGNRLAIALESQLYPDTLNKPEFPGNAVLRPGETYHHTVIYRFSTK